MSIKKNSRLFLVLVVALLTGCMGDSYKRLSNEVARSFKDKKSKKSTLEVFSNIRLKLYREGSLGFINFRNDTFFIVQIYSPERGYPFGSIWNTQKTISYISEGVYIYKNMKIVDSFIYSKAIFDRLNNWDTTYFKSKAANFRSFHHNYVYASRIIIKDGNAKVSSVLFEDFGLADEQ